MNDFLVYLLNSSICLSILYLLFRTLMRKETYFKLNRIVLLSIVLCSLIIPKLIMVLVDLGDAIKYESHPEIAVNNAWSTTKLKEELKKMRGMGLEPIPKLNFAAGHDAWLKKYSRMVSTDIYYGVCKDLIEEVSDLFDKPRLFHLGMDEENADDQRYLQLAVIRQHAACTVGL